MPLQPLDPRRIQFTPTFNSLFFAYNKGWMNNRQCIPTFDYRPQGLAETAWGRAPEEVSSRRQQTESFGAAFYKESEQFRHGRIKQLLLSSGSPT
jgi:hypothetical protein